MTSTPVLYYDGDCHFCRRGVGWLRQWGSAAGQTELIYVRRAEAPSEFHEATLKAILLVDSQGRNSQGARALFKALAILGHPRLWKAYESNSVISILCDGFYRMVSRFRSPLSRLFDVLLGPPPEDL